MDFYVCNKHMNLNMNLNLNIDTALYLESGKLQK